MNKAIIIITSATARGTINQSDAPDIILSLRITFRRALSFRVYKYRGSDWNSNIIEYINDLIGRWFLNGSGSGSQI
jgi:hypothetical protein